MQSRLRAPVALAAALLAAIRVILIQGVTAGGGRLVGAHDMFCHSREIRGFKRAFTADPTAGATDRQRPSVLDQ